MKTQNTALLLTKIESYVVNEKGSIQKNKKNLKDADEYLLLHKQQRVSYFTREY